MEKDPDRYWKVRDALIEKGLIDRGRGYGGSVHRIVALEREPPTEATAEAVEAITVIASEAELYGPMRRVIETDFAREHRANPLAVEITASQGRRQTGGRWSRPDIVSVEVKTYRYVPGKYIDVVTFEVKPHDAVDVSAIYEALAHRRSATRSYVLLHIPAEHAAALEPVVTEICEVARGHGIGVLTARDAGDYTTWVEREEAVRHEPDPDRLDLFLATQITRDTGDEILRALR